MARLFRLTELQMAPLRPLLPSKPRGVPRVDDRRVIPGIARVLPGGARQINAPGVCEPCETPYNRWVHWARAGVWRHPF